MFVVVCGFVVWFLATSVRCWCVSLYANPQRFVDDWSGRKRNVFCCLRCALLLMYVNVFFKAQSLSENLWNSSFTFTCKFEWKRCLINWSFIKRFSKQTFPLYMNCNLTVIFPEKNYRITNTTLHFVMKVSMEEIFWQCRYVNMLDCQINCNQH